MDKNYQWRTTMRLVSGGYAGEEVGIDPKDTGWRTASSASGSSRAKYYFRDSNNATNENSSRVVIDISDRWTAEIDAKNNLVINVTTTVNSIVRDDIRGYIPANALGRDIALKRVQGGATLWSVTADPIHYAHTILGNPVEIGTSTFTLAPGEDASQSSLYVRNSTQGHSGDPLPSEYVDAIKMGAEFKNILPADYRPGAILNTSGVWLSHNRNGGEIHVLGADGKWHEERTVAGLEEHDNPPSIRYKDSWYNQRLIGKE